MYVDEFGLLAAYYKFLGPFLYSSRGSQSFRELVAHLPTLGIGRLPVPRLALRLSDVPHR